LDLRNSENTARYVFKRRGHITWNIDRQTDRRTHLQPPVLCKYLLFLPTCMLLLLDDPHDREIRLNT